MSYDPENIPEDAAYAGSLRGWNDAVSEISAWISNHRGATHDEIHDFVVTLYKREEA